MSEIELVEEKSGGAPVSVDPGALIARAIDKGVSVEQMERLLVMRRELKAEWAREQFFRSLATFQRDCPTIIKSAAVDFANKRGGTTHYNYAPLDVIVTAVKANLEACGFSYTVKTSQSDAAVTSTCEAHHIDGHTEATSFTIPIDKEAYMNDAQKVASAMTYSKRYAFCNAFGIMTGDADDDARKLTPEHPEQMDPPAATTQTDDMENWTWAQVFDGDGNPCKAPQSYWAKKGNHPAQQLALVERFGSAEAYKVEKTVHAGVEGWYVFRKLNVSTEPGQKDLKDWTPEAETPA